MSAIPTEAYNLAVKPMLPTIPLFTLAGFILAEGGTPRRLVELFRALVGWLPGGVAIAAIVVCAFFTSFTGGSGVTILAMGGLLFPMLLERKYTPKFATGLLTSAGSLGLLFPPSLAVILYWLVAEIELPHLFVAGFVPAVLEIAIVAGFALYAARKVGIERVPFDSRRCLSALRKAKWEVAIPFIVLGSILGGFATLVEAAAVTVLYAFILEGFASTWDSRFPSISKSWRSRWENVIPFFSYPAPIRKVIYTTNAVESVNASIRKVTAKRGAFPTVDAVSKVLYLAIQKASERWRRPIKDWTAALNHFTIVFEERVPN